MIEAPQYPSWFEAYAVRMFERHLLPLAGKPGLRFLQIGAFTGDASVWMLENVLTGRGSRLVDVDTWEGSEEPVHGTFDWDDVWQTYRSRTSGYVVECHCKTSREFLAGSHDPFDFVYIDGDHTPVGVLEDAVAAYRLLRPGGLIAFDDYKWTHPTTGVGPGLAVDAIAEIYKGRLQIIQAGPQAWFRKTA